VKFFLIIIIIKKKIRCPHKGNRRRDSSDLHFKCGLQSIEPSTGKKRKKEEEERLFLNIHHIQALNF
jgi:hypothetical protein